MNYETEANGQVLVFMGAGKGKTTAAVGVASRVVAHAGKTIFIYLTGPDHPLLGEVKTATAFGGNWRTIGIKSEAKDISYLDSFTESVDTARDALTMAQTLWIHECDLLVLDDISPHLDRGSIDISQVLALIDNRPPNTSIILTGSSVPEPIIQRADSVTELLLIKQPSNAGMRSRQGINF